MLGLSLLIRKKVSPSHRPAALTIAALCFVLTTGAWCQSTEKVVAKLVNGNGGLTLGQDGDLYGTDQKLTRYGAIYRLHHYADGVWGKTILYHFSGPDGASPQPNLVFDAAGNLYGTTAIGGDNNEGVVFQLTPAPSGPWTETVLYKFELGPDGFGPPGGLVIDGKGNLYGVTFLGPHGTVYEMVHNPDGTWTHQVIYQFTGGTDGGNPQNRLVLDGAGNLYGTTFDGNPGATVFELSPETDGSWTFHLIHTFCSLAKCADGTPGEGSASVTLDSHGNLYGMTSQGGNTNCFFGTCGTVFKLTHLKTGAWTFQLLHRFCSLENCADGVFPAGGVVVDGSGKVYGTTAAGGAHGFGTVFEISEPPGKSWTENVLYSFCSASKCADGQNPAGSLAFDNLGNLFGSTEQVVFEVIP